MKSISKLILPLIYVLCMMLASCANSDIVLSQKAENADKSQTSILQMVVTPQSISKLYEYPALEKVDLSGSHCYEEIFAYAENNPSVDVTYTVKFGNVEVSNKQTTMNISSENYDFRQFTENIKFLPLMKTVNFENADFRAEVLSDLRTLYPEIEFNCKSVCVLGTVLNGDIQILDLSGVTREAFSASEKSIGLFEKVEQVNFMKPDGSTVYELADVKVVKEIFPLADINYSFDLFGKIVSYSDEKIEFVKTPLGNESLDELRNALSLLDNCRYLLLDDCGIENEFLGALRDEFPEKEIVWRIYAGRNSSFLTDSEVIRIVYGLEDNNCDALRFCNKAKYMDIGHNTDLYDFDFITGMTSLEIVIASGSPIKDASVFANCPNLEFLELAWCGLLTNISGLENCTNLRHLNICYSKVTDVSALDNIPLEQFSYLVPKITVEQQQEFIDKHPSCAVKFEGTGEYGTVWRYKEDGGYTDIYRKVRDVFGYDDMVLTPETMLPDWLRDK